MELTDLRLYPMAARRVSGKSAIACLGVIALLADFGDAQFAWSQSASYLIPAKPRTTFQGPGANAALTIHRNALGAPCLNFEAMSRAHISNPEIYDNIVSIKSQCAQRIMVKVCYFGTDGCVDVEVAPFQRKDAILGVRPQSQFFRYSYKEKL